MSFLLKKKICLRKSILKFKNIDDENDILEISKGRFDINLATLNKKKQLQRTTGHNINT